MIRIDCVDNRDATTVNVTVTGSTGGTITLYAQPVDLLNSGDDTWQLVGTRTGDGLSVISIAAIIGNCSFWMYGVDGVTLSAPVLSSCTGSLAIATRCRLSVIAVLKTLNLPDIGDAIYERVHPTLSNTSNPCIILSPNGYAESEKLVLNNRDDIIYPLVLAIVRHHKFNDDEPLPQVELWRQAIHDAFRHQRLPGVDESIQVQVEPLIIAKPLEQAEMEGYQHWVCGMVLRCYCRQRRGLNVN